VVGDLENRDRDGSFGHPVGDAVAVGHPPTPRAQNSLTVTMTYSDNPLP
jgi:hypothetical protein